MPSALASAWPHLIFIQDMLGGTNSYFAGPEPRKPWSCLNPQQVWVTLLPGPSVMLVLPNFEDLTLREIADVWPRTPPGSGRLQHQPKGAAPPVLRPCCWSWQPRLCTTRGQGAAEFPGGPAPPVGYTCITSGFGTAWGDYVKLIVCTRLPVHLD